MAGGLVGLLGIASCLEQQGLPEVNAKFEAAISEILPVDSAAQRIAAVEAVLVPLSKALNKNRLGRFPLHAARHLLHRHLAGHRAWHLKGLEPIDLSRVATPLHEIGFVAGKAPALKQALKDLGVPEHGVSLREVAMLSVALEQLLLGDSAEHLKLAYKFSDRATGEELGRTGLRDVLVAYVLILNRGSTVVSVTQQTYKTMLAEQQSDTDDWIALSSFVDSVISAAAQHVDSAADLVATQRYSFQQVLDIAKDLTVRYGEFQNQDCQAMKQDLVRLDHGKTGRVQLTAFYGRGKTSKYEFAESRRDLRIVGALDESAPGVPSVVIANYVDGANNCVAPFSHYSICCISECTAVMEELETKVQAPAVSPEQLAFVVGNLSIPSAPVAQNLSEALLRKLHVIAGRHDGLVPIHGRLFARWLHLVFPHGCPLPATAMLMMEKPEPSGTATARPEAQRMDDKGGLRTADASAGRGIVSRAVSAVVQAVVILAMLHMVVRSGRTALFASAGGKAWDASEDKALLTELQEGASAGTKSARKQPRQSAGAAISKQQKKQPKKPSRVADERTPSDGPGRRQKQKLPVTGLVVQETAADSLEGEGVGVTAPVSKDAELTEAVNTATFMVAKELLNCSRADAPADPNASSADGCDVILEEWEDLKMSGDLWRSPAALVNVLVPFLDDLSKDAGKPSHLLQTAPPPSESKPEPAGPRTPEPRAPSAEGPPDPALDGEAREAVGCPAPPPGLAPPQEMAFRPPPGLEMLRPLWWACQAADGPEQSVQQAPTAAPPDDGEPLRSEQGLTERLRALEEALREERAARQRLEGILLGRGDAPEPTEARRTEA